MIWPREVGNWILGIPPRIQEWLAAELEYRELSREEAARELLRGAIDSGEVAGTARHPRRPNIFALPRRPADGVLSFTDPELRRRWRQP